MVFVVVVVVVVFLCDNIFHLDVHYVCYTMLVQRFEPQGRRFTDFHYCYLSSTRSDLGAFHYCYCKFNPE